MQKKYSLIYADPPWSFDNKKTGGSMKSGASQKYDVMTMDKLKRLDVESIAADDCVLVMWWVGSMPKEALDLVEAWGFTLKTMTGFVWRKLTTKGNPDFGMGHWTRAGSECALIATRGRPKRVSASVRSVHEINKSKHSAKPNEFRDLLVELCGDVPRVELFSRGNYGGWDVFGNQCDNSIDVGFKNE